MKECRRQKARKRDRKWYVWVWHSHCKHNLTATVLTCIGPVQAIINNQSAIKKGLVEYYYTWLNFSQQECSEKGYLFSSAVYNKVSPIGSSG